MKKTLCLILASVLGASAFGSMLMQIISTHNGPAVVIDGVTYYLPAFAVTEPTTNYPAGFAVFDFTPNTTNVSASAPQIAEWTRQNQPGDTMALTAENLNPTNALFVFSDDGSEVLAGGILVLDDRQCAVTLPDGLSSNAFYLAWPYNSAGFGEPVGINQAELWWCDYIAATGSTFRVFGQNLELDGTSHLYIKELDTWLSTTNCNPYMAEYTLPASATAGTYTIYAHNGHGGKYGWSGSLSLNVWGGWQFSEDTNTWYDVTDYGVVGDGVTDNRTALHSLVSTLRNNAWPTVYFPEGNYLIAGTDAVIIYGAYSGFRLLGGGTNSIISCQTPATQKSSIKFDTGGKTLVQDLAFRKLDTGLGTSSYALEIRNGTTANNIEFRRVLFDDSFADAKADPLRTMFATSGGGVSPNGIKFVDCDFVVNRHWDLSANTTTYESCNFWGMDDVGGYGVGARNGLALIDCHNYSHYDSSVVTNGLGWGKGRWFTSGANKVAANWYISGNTSTNAQPRYYPGMVSANPGDGGDWNDWNAGEQFMKEGGVAKFRAMATGSTSNSVTLTASPTALQAAAGWTLFIADGKGVGQSRFLSSVAGNIINVTENWRVYPDETSVVIIGQIAKNWVLYNNYLHADLSAYTTSETCASAGLQFYYGAGGHNIIADSNIFDGLFNAVYLRPDSTHVFHSPYGTVSPLFFSVMTENRFENCENAILDGSSLYYQSTSGNEYPNDAIWLGQVFRRNLISGTKRVVFKNVAVDSSIYRGVTVWDGNYVTNTTGVFSTSQHSRDNDIWIGNLFSGSTNGLQLVDSKATIFQNNAWSGFSTTYTGTLPGAVLQIPQGTVPLANASETVSMYNVGTTGLTWTATDNAAWLSVTDSGSIAAESSGTMTLSRSGSTTNGATALVSVVAVGQTNVFTVIYGTELGTP